MTNTATMIRRAIATKLAKHGLALPKEDLSDLVWDIEDVLRMHGMAALAERLCDHSVSSFEWTR